MNSKMRADLQPSGWFCPTSIGDPASEGCLEGGADGCPRLRVAGYRSVPLIRDDNGSWIPPVKWAPFQERAPTRQEIVDWWMKCPNAGIALVCGRLKKKSPPKPAMKREQL